MYKYNANINKNTLEYQEAQLILFSNTSRWTPEVSNNETYGNRSNTFTGGK